MYFIRNRSLSKKRELHGICYIMNWVTLFIFLLIGKIEPFPNKPTFCSSLISCLNIHPNVWFYLVVDQFFLLSPLSPLSPYNQIHHHCPPMAWCWVGFRWETLGRGSLPHGHAPCIWPCKWEEWLGGVAMLVRLMVDWGVDVLSNFQAEMMALSTTKRMLGWRLTLGVANSITRSVAYVGMDSN